MEKQRNKILLTESTARTLAQMKTNKGLNSLAELCNSFKTYGKIPTDRAYRYKGEKWIKNLNLCNLIFNFQNNVNIN